MTKCLTSTGTTLRKRICSSLLAMSICTRRWAHETRSRRFGIRGRVGARDCHWGDYCMSARDDPRGALIAAEVALSEGELTTAEQAALEALSRIRYQQQEGDQ